MLYIVVWQKFEHKLISAKFLLPMISSNELSITLSTLCYYTHFLKQWEWGQGLLQLQAWVSTKWSLMNSFFTSLILIFHQYSVSKIHFYGNHSGLHLQTHRPFADTWPPISPNRVPTSSHQTGSVSWCFIMFKSVSWCFTGGSRCFAPAWQCFMIFHKCFMMFY